MQIEIVKTSRKKYAHLGDYLFMEMKADNQHVTVAVAPDYLNVCSHNASNRAWRGVGRRFETAEAAIAGYKTAAIKEMIRLAVKTKAESMIDVSNARSPQ
jgi:hypothetical protein